MFVVLESMGMRVNMCEGTTWYVVVTRVTHPQGHGGQRDHWGYSAAGRPEAACTYAGKTVK